MALKIRRGLETDRASVTPEEGEFLYVTDTGLLYIGDGSTAGGNLVSGGGGLESATASGTDTYTATISGVTSYATHDVYEIIFTNANTGSSTININTLGAKTLKKSVSTNLASGDILAGQSYIIVYDGTNFQVIGIGTPGGSDTQVQFNDGGAFAGDATYTFNKTTKVLTAQAINLSGETASRIASLDASKNVKSLDTGTYPSLAELAYVKGVNSAIQTQIDAKAAISSTLTSNAPSTASSTITLDFSSTKHLLAVGSASFSGAKTIALTNNSNALVFNFHFELSASGTLTMPSSFLMDTGESRWNSGTKVLTITGAGKYELSGTYDGTNWKIKSSANSGYV